jgi:hypothetical protein
MTRRSRLALLVAVALIEVAVVLLLPGVPVRWTKGVVRGAACQRMADAYACEVELVPDGSRVTARSARAIATGDGVRLVVWLDLASGEDRYTVVR